MTSDLVTAAALIFSVLSFIVAITTAIYSILSYYKNKEIEMMLADIHDVLQNGENPESNIPSTGEPESFGAADYNSRIIAGTLDEFLKKIIENPAYRNNHLDELKNIKEMFDNMDLDNLKNDSSEPDSEDEDDDDEPWKKRGK